MHLEDWSNLFFAVLNCAIGIIGLLSNILVSVTLFKTKQLDSTINVLFYVFLYPIAV